MYTTSQRLPLSQSRPLRPAARKCKGEVAASQAPAPRGTLVATFAVVACRIMPAAVRPPLEPPFNTSTVKLTGCNPFGPGSCIAVLDSGLVLRHAAARSARCPCARCPCAHVLRAARFWSPPPPTPLIRLDSFCGCGEHVRGKVTSKRQRNQGAHRGTATSRSSTVEGLCAACHPWPRSIPFPLD